MAPPRFVCPPSWLVAVPAEGLHGGCARAGPLRHRAAGRTPVGVPVRVRAPGPARRVCVPHRVPGLAVTHELGASGHLVPPARGQDGSDARPWWCSPRTVPGAVRRRTTSCDGHRSRLPTRPELIAAGPSAEVRARMEQCRTEHWGDRLPSAPSPWAATALPGRCRSGPSSRPSPRTPTRDRRRLPHLWWRPTAFTTDGTAAQELPALETPLTGGRVTARPEDRAWVIS